MFSKKISLGTLATLIVSLTFLSACSKGGNSGGNGQGIGGGKPAGAAGSCGAPLAVQANGGKSWCTSEPEANGQFVVSIATFNSDCSGIVKRYRYSAQGQATELPSTNFDWNLADKILTVDPRNGQVPAKSDFEFDAKSESFVADKITFSACTVEAAKK